MLYSVMCRRFFLKKASVRVERKVRAEFCVGILKYVVLLVEVLVAGRQVESSVYNKRSSIQSKQLQEVLSRLENCLSKVKLKEGFRFYFMKTLL